MKRFLEGLKALGLPRLLGLAGVGLTVLGIIGFVALRGVSQPMALLYSDLEAAGFRRRSPPRSTSCTSPIN